VVAYPGDEQQAALRLARVGLDEAVGYVNVGPDGRFPAELADLVQTAPRTTVPELDERLTDGAVTLLDVRNPGERDGGAIPSSLHIPLAQLRPRISEIPTDKPIVVHCAGGWRSSVAASLLRANGIQCVSDLIGGYNAWADTHSAALPWPSR